MKNLLLRSASMLMMLSGSVYAQQTISVTVKTSTAKAGVVHATLCNSAKDFLNQSFRESSAKADPNGNTVLTFSGIPKGNYALRLYQDINGDGVVNTGIFGIPKEPFGFSNNPSVSFGPPSFKKASFAVRNAPVALTVRLVSPN